MQAHAEDLRSEVPERGDVWIEALKQDWRAVKLTEREEAICSYGAKLNKNPGDMNQEDLAPLRQAGLDDRAILDLAHLVGFFAYANIVVEGLGCDPEPKS